MTMNRNKVISGYGFKVDDVTKGGLIDFIDRHRLIFLQRQITGRYKNVKSRE